jgi:hypothetical protein
MVVHNINPLNTQLNPTCHLLALLRAHLILHVSRIRVKACTAPPCDYKCINCVNYKHNGSAKVRENHSSMDKTCPSLQDVIRKDKINTEYQNGNNRAPKSTETQQHFPAMHPDKSKTL